MESHSSTDERVSRLLERHAELLSSQDSCDQLAARLKALHRQKASSARGSRLIQRAFGIAWRLGLMYAFWSVSLHCLESSFPKVSHDWRVGRTLSYLNLVYLKSYRWLTVQLGFYHSEFLHRRDREACLVPNPFYRPPVMCCGCQQLPASLPSVALNNPAGRNAFRRVVDSHASPFLVADSSHRTVTYAELRRFVFLDAWEEISAGSNRVSVQGASAQSVESISQMLADPNKPPEATLTVWTFGHMSAIRAMRRLIPMPPFVRPDVDVGFARAFYVFAGPLGEEADLGDLSQFQGLAMILGLHGSVRVTLSLKAECCPHSSNASVALSPGQTLVVPTQCYALRASRIDYGDGAFSSRPSTYAMLHLVSVFSSTGIKQHAPITGRLPEVDEVEGDY